MIFKGESTCRALALYFHFRALLMPLCQCPSVNGEDYNGRKKERVSFICSTISAIASTQVERWVIRDLKTSQFQLMQR